LVHYGKRWVAPGCLMTRRILRLVTYKTSIILSRPTLLVDLFIEDWTAQFKLLEEGRGKPIVAQKFPILIAAKAKKLLEGRQVTGNVVLLAQELLK
jgi:NADPH:quinone reductase-like Zn-dependent oxidoreductase